MLVHTLLSIAGLAVFLIVGAVFSAMARKRRIPQMLVTLGMVGILVLIGVLVSHHNSSPSPSAYPSSTYRDPYPSSSPSPSAYPSSTYRDPYPSSSPSPSAYPSSTYRDPYPSSSFSASPVATPAKKYASGTCLNGTLPDSTTAQSVNDVNEVGCDSTDAHYKVIQVFVLTSDLSRCDSVSNTQYAFSSEETLNGVPFNSYVYCLVGLGSYAR